MTSARTTILALAMLAAGCGKASVAPVSARVTLDGKPLAGVHVSFQPIAPPGKQEPGVGSYALKDAEGKYTLLLVDNERPGAVVGKHRVEITARSDVPANIDVPTRPPPKVAVPSRYNRNSE